MIELTKTQRRVLSEIDGINLSVSGDYSFPARFLRPLVQLSGMGLVTFEREKRGRRVYYYARLTRAGSDFIFNGGIDS